MKMKKEHRVPLSARALELVKAQPAGDYIFHGDRTKSEPFSDMAMLSVLKRMGCSDVTVHGFRSTFRDWAAELTSYPHQMAEIALAHSVGSEVEKAYLRTDMMEKRRKLMSDWQRYCDTLKADAKVLPMKRKA